MVLTELSFLRFSAFMHCFIVLVFLFSEGRRREWFVGTCVVMAVSVMLSAWIAVMS